MPNAKRLETRRKELLARSSELRRTMSIHNHELAQSAARVDRAISFVARIRQHPGVIVAIVAALVAIRPRRLAPVVSGGLMAVRALKVASGFAPVLQALRARQSGMALH